jgi:hypothetical protein
VPRIFIFLRFVRPHGWKVLRHAVEMPRYSPWAIQIHNHLHHLNGDWTSERNLWHPSRAAPSMQQTCDGKKTEAGHCCRSTAVWNVRGSTVQALATRH